VNSEFNKVSVQ